MTYGRFFAMIATSTIVMFGLMYLNTYALDHIFFSQITDAHVDGDLHGRGNGALLHKSRGIPCATPGC